MGHTSSTTLTACGGAPALGLVCRADTGMCTASPACCPSIEGRVCAGAADLQSTACMTWKRLFRVQEKLQDKTQAYLHGGEGRCSPTSVPSSAFPVMGSPVLGGLSLEALLLSSKALCRTSPGLVLGGVTPAFSANEVPPRAKCPGCALCLKPSSSCTEEGMMWNSSSLHPP